MSKIIQKDIYTTKKRTVVCVPAYKLHMDAIKKAGLQSCCSAF